jgi:hypothetical protein
VKWLYGYGFWLYLGLLVLLLLEVENCSSFLFPLAGVLRVLEDILYTVS